VFGEKGFEQASMAEIAARVGVVEGALYKHFPSKRELLFEAVRDHLEPRFQATAEQLAGVRGTRNRLRFVIWRHLREFVDDPGMCRLIIQEIRPYGDYRGSALRDLIRENTTLLSTVLAEAQASGELRAGVRPAVVRDLVYGGIEHLAFRVLAGLGAIDADALADEVTDLVLVGVDGGRETRAEEENERLRAQIDRLEALLDGVERRGRARS
jgi:AcrR family transcriptional regulator